MNPKYPVYIISKGRAETPYTARALEKIGIPYRIVIEPQELNAYAKTIPAKNIYQLPFSNLGQGSIPARNWCWEDSLHHGHKMHWILDDNIFTFYRLNRNEKIRFGTGTPFKCAEDFIKRYDNVGIAGFNYQWLAKAKQLLPPFYLNTRIYSCLLIRNDLPYRWRGRYNEDTDLCLRALKDNWCTVLFLAFLADKATTMTLKGGNSDELYKDDGRLKMAQSLVDQHPDVARVSWKFGRYQHHVDYSQFQRNQLKLKPGIVVPQGVNNYGMVLQVDEPYYKTINGNLVHFDPGVVMGGEIGSAEGII